MNELSYFIFDNNYRVFTARIEEVFVTLYLIIFTNSYYKSAKQKILNIDIIIH